MGFPTFTFETDDEQFIPGSFENLNDRLEEEMDVMRYLINNVWYWRARLDVRELQVSSNDITLDVVNHGQASTSNATIQYVDSTGEVLWTSEAFTVNASNSTTVSFDLSGISPNNDGSWQMYYQKRVINASTWVTEAINTSVIKSKNGDKAEGLFGFGIFNPLTVIISVIGLAAILKPEDEEIEELCQPCAHDN